MPELPEVEAARALAETHCLNKPITHVNAVPDEKVFDNTTAEEVASKLRGKSITAAKRLGKHLWFEFNSPSTPALLLHLGMSGGTCVRNHGGAHYQRYSVDGNGKWPPRFLKLELTLDDGTQWAFCDSRRFARIRTIPGDPTKVPPLSLLGPDPLLSWPDLETFAASLAKQRRAIKAVLLDQTFSAGVGNWVADEVLFQTRIHPEQPGTSLSQEQITALHAEIPRVCRMAAEVGAVSEKLPDNWLFHYRWTKGQKTVPTILGHKINHITVGGRTSAYVPALQKLVKVPVVAGNAKTTKAKRKQGVEVEVQEVDIASRKKGQTVIQKSKTTTVPRASTTVTRSAAKILHVMKLMG